VNRKKKERKKANYLAIFLHWCRWNNSWICNYANATGEFLWRQRSIITLMLSFDYKLVNLPVLDDPFLLRRLFCRMRQKLNSKIPIKRERNYENIDNMDIHLQIWIGFGSN